MNQLDGSRQPLPDRFKLPTLVNSIVFVIAVTFIIWSMVRAELSVTKFIAGLPWMAEAAQQMVPPSTRDWPQFWRISNNLLTTLQMAVAGGVIGIIISFGIAWMAARNHSPHWSVYALTRGVITLFRTVPDVIWALFFMVTVGLGPFAGALAIMVDTIGYCGRFYAESMEEVDPAPGESLRAMGAGTITVAACSTIPAALPAMTAHSLYAMERAVRSSVILGIVGAGGIGQEIETFITMDEWPYASTCILMIFIMVLGIEQLSAWMRRRLL
ncbi:MAG: phosphonate ABC transporter, permease protein PhnE [Planctomycetota bacterium]|nr:MAG: phosphonate ABC transporter, permease protein PhnE [Planctomycetota bacterium]